MTRYFLRLIALLSILAAIVAGIGSLLPRDYQFETTIRIDSEPAKIFPLINQVSNWSRWSQWSPDRIEGLRVEYNGNQAGVGSAQSWTDQRGDGKLWIVASETDRSVAYKMIFGGFPEMDSTITLTESNDQTQVVWASDGRLPGGPFYGFFGPFFANGMRAEYDKSLARLKELAETLEPKSADPEPTE